MYKKLHYRLTLLFTGIAGAILITMSISYLYMSEKELQQNRALAFSSQVASLLSSLEQQASLTWEWLSKTAVSQNFILSIYDNGSPISYNRIVLSDQEITLADEAMEYAQKNFASLSNGSHYSAAHQEFSWISNDNKGYDASFFNMRKNSGTLTGLILSSRDVLDQQIHAQRYRFLFFNIAGILALLLFSWHYTGKLLKPIIESRRKQAAFVASASHELRTPIAVICSAVSASKSANEVQKDHFLHIIAEESLRLSTLADDLLLLNRADTERFELELAPVELDTLLLNTYEAFEPLARQHHISLQISLPEEPLPRCSCDSRRIQQALSILISNSFSYGTPGGYTKLTLSYDKSMFWIMVEDNGIGIEEKDKPFIFERFYRADKSRSAKEHFGLGLCIAQEIITAHGGKIAVTDTPGGGARFFILLRHPAAKS